MNKENFGRYIANARRNAGLTQQDLANRLNVTNTAVSKWERGLCYPDITILEKLAQALGLTLSQLLSSESNSDITQTEEGMTSLLDIAKESCYKQKAKIWRSILFTALAVALLFCLVYVCFTFTKVHVISARYIGCQTKGEQTFVYMERKDDLLCLLCEDPETFKAITSDLPGKYYSISYRFNPITQQGTLIACAVKEAVGSITDQIGSSIGINSLLGIACVNMEYVYIYPDPNREHNYLYTLTYSYTGSGNHYTHTGEKNHLLTVEDCRGATAYDYDADGIVELFVQMKYGNAPYVLYDIENGTIFHTFVDEVPPNVAKALDNWI